jgi:hypothetical protein
MKVTTELESKTMRGKLQFGRKLLLAAALLLAVNSLMAAHVGALSGLTNTYLRLDRMKQGTSTSFRVVFKTSAATATEDSVKIDFNYGGATTWTAASGTVAASPTVSTATCASETGVTALPGSFGSSSSTGAVMTIAGVTNLAASTSYCFDVTGSALLTPNTPGEYLAKITTQTGATVDDQTNTALRIVSDDSITVTATVPPTFNFQLDSNTTAFTADLTPGTKRTTTARTFTVNTNAKTGWVAWLRNSDSNGLYSVGVSKDIAPTTPGTAVDVDAAANTEQYVWGATGVTQGTGVGTTTLTTAFDATGGTNEGSGVDNSYRQVASSDGTAGNAVVSLAAAATISGVTPAASDYTDVIQVIGAGQF